MAGGRRSPPAPCCPGRAAMPSPCCQGRVAVPSVHQSLSEMDFERGIWAAARDGDEARVLQLLERRGDPAEPDLAGYTALVHRGYRGHRGAPGARHWYTGGTGGHRGPDLTGHMALAPGARPWRGGPGGLWGRSCPGSRGSLGSVLPGVPGVAGSPEAAPCPQHYASRNGHLGVCRLLLERGAPCDARTPGGATPLHRACYRGHRAVTELLLAHGADPAAADGDGKTGLHKGPHGKPRPEAP
ncbi:ankyrin repeat domain-containing protein 39 isoform X2 [Onychostruthus taczanowskii]|uniref:ankyrin repeat domain-containing protein 39 isoform X2 n=1 Tax=Onychostruthus taczanowskii TaxID=356909 RepID=UPI001B80DED6|nr:ankyrin repeat domain-containing protein 39 isoform X2 [Onychostruthus taczanowskii]